MIKNLTCIICPRGCALTVDTDKKTVSGNSCKRGEVYGINECINPVRTVTSSMKVENREYTAVSVKTDKPVAKSDMFKVVEEIKKAKVFAPVKCGEVIIKDICGANVIATKSID